MSRFPVFFKDVNFLPPGGLFFYERDGERVTGRTFLEIAPKVKAILARHGIATSVEAEIADYMCARMPDPGRYCRGASVAVQHVTPHVAIANSMPYCSPARQVVAFDEVERRLRVCSACPKHRRDWCPTCSGHVSRMMSAFGGRRRKVPEDTLAGVCQCAKAYELAIASVEYGEGDKVWDGVPDTCWRKTGV